MKKKTIHYSGGVRVKTKRGLSIRLAGWPVCCSGDRAVEIADHGNQSNDRDVVTCAKCLRMIHAEGSVK